MPPPNPPVDVEVVPHNEGLNRTQVQPFEGVVHHEAVLARVLIDLVEVLLQQSLLLQYGVRVAGTDGGIQRGSIRNRVCICMVLSRHV